jgi:DNA-binding transcriptional MerR regulator
MKEHYKIGDVSKMLGIPMQTLRYYEEQGIVHPKKDENSGYRYYNAWDVNFLMDSVYLRSLDFPLSQIEQILNTDDLEDICGKFMRQESILLKKIENYKTMLRVLSGHRQKLQIFQKDLGSFRIANRSGVLFWRFRLKDVFQSSEGEQNLDKMQQYFAQWLSIMPEIVPTFIVPYSTLGQVEKKDISYWWGWSMPVEEALQHGIDPEAPNEYLHPCRCLYTVFEAGGEGTFSETFYEQVYQPVIQKGYEICGNPMGRLLIKTHDDTGIHRYFETWIPVELS